MRKRQNISLGHTHKHGLMYCSGFDLYFSAEPDASLEDIEISQTIISVEAFQTRYAGEKQDNPRKLLKQEFNVIHNKMYPEMLSIKTDDKTPMGHPCNDSILLKLDINKDLKREAMPSEFEINETQSGVKVELKNAEGWTHTVNGRRLTLYGPDGIKVGFESQRGYID